MVTDKAREDANARRRWFSGLALIALGAVLLADRMGMLESQLLWHFWPALIAIFGLGRMVGATRADEVVRGLMTVLLALWAYACLEHLWDWSFRSTWPLILIGFGLSRILEGLTWRQNRAAANNNNERTQA
jgi:hypothetical protein